MADLSQLTHMVIDLQEHLDATYGESARIRTVLVAVEVTTDDRTEVVVWGDDRPWVKAAFLEEAVATVEQERDALPAGDDDDYASD